MRVAVVDQGTNSARLLLAEVEEGRVRSLVRRATVTRLGQGVDHTHRLDPAAVQRTLECLTDYAAQIEAFAPQRRLLIATSVLRDAVDGAVFLAELESRLGLPWRLLSGAEEAVWAYRGARAGLADVAGTAVVVDIGGGSTELAVGAGPLPDWSRSLEVGVVRLTERFLTSDPPTEQEWRAALACTRALLTAEVPDPVADAVDAGIGVAGTVTTLVAHKLQMREYDATLVHGHLLSQADVEAAACTFRRLAAAERARLPGIQRGREDVILAGALIAGEVCRRFGLAGLTVSESDILEGGVLFVAEQADEAARR
jgi:exopolyphosphatase/guanosine-5'-triphosphate,3'-diphosphate pyrophosphatase